MPPGLRTTRLTHCVNFIILSHAATPPPRPPRLCRSRSVPGGPRLLGYPLSLLPLSSLLRPYSHPLSRVASSTGQRPRASLSPLYLRGLVCAIIPLRIAATLARHSAISGPNEKRLLRWPALGLPHPEHWCCVTFCLLAGGSSVTSHAALSCPCSRLRRRTRGSWSVERNC